MSLGFLWLMSPAADLTEPRNSRMLSCVRLFVSLSVTKVGLGILLYWFQIGMTMKFESVPLVFPCGPTIGDSSTDRPLPGGMANTRREAEGRDQVRSAILYLPTT
jgi:hypothetical protein